MNVSIFPANRLLKLKLPISLNDLNLKLIHSSCDPDCVFDIEDLIDLKSLTYIDFPNTILWFLPPKLTKINGNSGSIDLGDTFLSCPNLQTIDYRTVSYEWTDEELETLRSFTMKNIKQTQVTELPSTLVDLRLPLEDFDNVMFNENNYYSSPPPGSVAKLQTLFLYGEISRFDDSDDESIYDSTFNPVLDFQSERFSSLHCLGLVNANNLTIKGDLPVTLTKLTLARCNESTFNALETLINLTELYIQEMFTDSPFDYELPPSLRFMSISECTFSDINIKAMNLLSFHIHYSELFHVTNQKLILPSTLIELDLSFTEVRTIDNDFNWPPEMERLDLGWNYLSTLAGLPPSLKHLDLAGNEFYKCDFQQEWPEALEELHLGDNRLDLNLFQTLNLTRCTKLKYLDLSENEIFDLPNFLPELSHLEEIRISPRKELFNLQLFETSKSGDIFGPSVKYVDIRGIYVTAEDCETIVEELFQKPNFQRLIMTKEHLLDEYRPYVLDRRIIVEP
ncbi:hypothetical protein G210_2023, partial [Candida maltosa Xu316]